MRALVFVLAMSPLFAPLGAQERPAYRIFHADGREATYGDVLQKAEKADVFFFGELHNNPICHWLQLEMTQDLYAAKKGKLALGAEMFERDNQLLIDEYLSGQVTQKSFEEEVRLWKNYTTDYKPLLEFAKAQKIPFIGTNIPRRYANLVFRKGLTALDSLSADAKAYIAPLPIEVDLTLPSYKDMVAAMGGHGGPNSDNLPKSQASKDATMGYFIAQNLNKGHLFVHYNGTYHSDLKEGTVWYLKKYAPRTDVVTLASTEQKDISQLAPESKGKADFILVVPSNMTKTY